MMGKNQRHELLFNQAFLFEESPMNNDSVPAMDKVNANVKIDSASCEHFSIRGYVSNIRKDDWKLCWPFPSDDGGRSNEAMKSVFPLDVPKFRFWRCVNCLHEINPKCNIATNFERVLEPSSSGLLASDGNSFIISINGDHPLQPNVVDVGKEQDPSPLIDELGMETVDAAADPVTGSLNSTKELSETTKGTLVNHEQEESTSKATFVQAGEADVLNGCDFSSSESAKTEDAVSFVDLHHNYSSFPRRRRPRKVRLLADLLSDESASNVKKRNLELQYNGALLDALSNADKILPTAPQGPPVSYQGNARKGLGWNKNRKVNQNKDQKSLEQNSSSKVSFEENSPRYAGSELEADFGRMDLQSFTKIGMNKHKIKGSPFTSKKKTQKTLNFQEILPFRASLEDAGAIPKPVDDSFNGKGKTKSLYVQGTERKAGSYNKKMNVTQFDGHLTEDKSLREVIDHLPHNAIGISSPTQQKEYFSSSSNEKLHDVEKDSAISISRRAENSSEQRFLDDVPMEIVELMARNQYERCLANAEHDECQIEMSDRFANGQRLDSGEARRRAALSSSQQDQTSRKWKITEPTKQGLVDYFSQVELSHLETSPLEQSPSPTCFITFLEHQEKQPSSSSTMPEKHACNTFESIPRPASKEASHHWPSPGSKNLPLMHQINPENHVAHFTGIESVLGEEDAFGNHKLSSSLDMYSKETIPAMHLLSLMDAGVQSGVHHNAGQNSVQNLPQIGLYSASRDGRSFKTAMANDNASVSKAEANSHSSSFLASHSKSTPIPTTQKTFFRKPNSTVLPNQLHASWNPSGNESNIATTSRSSSHRKCSFETEICIVNRNPADFSIPEVGNIYTISGEDFKFGKKARSSANGSQSNRPGGLKRRRKLVALKDHERLLVS